MNLAVKELIVVLAISLAVFRIVRPIALQFCPAKEFTARCKVWLILSVAVFIAPSFWIFVFVATPVLLRLRKNDSNPAAAFLFLQTAVPPASARIPMIFDLSFRLLLIFCLLAPAAWRQWKNTDKSRAPGLMVLDVLLIAYCVISAWLFLQPEIAPHILMQPTFTDCLRRTLVISCNLFIPYFVISRASRNRAVIQDILASYTINCTVLAAVAIFEGARQWLLYGEFLPRWGWVSPAYISRAGEVRAMASAGHPLSLGCFLVVGFGVWLYLANHTKSRAARLATASVIPLGLLATYSRGPWAAAILVYLAYSALGPRAFRKSFKAVGAVALLGMAIAASPLGAKIASVIPYFSGVPDYNVMYRERLFDVSWRIIMDHPWLGDQEALLKMEELRQGEGIIDLVNGFIALLLNSGFVGLSLFVLSVSIASFKTFRLSAARAKTDPDLGKLGASLVACLLGCMFMMWVGGLLDEITFVLIALMAAYIDFGRRVSQDHQLRASDLPSIDEAAIVHA